jgi:hypothetical protein
MASWYVWATFGQHLKGNSALPNATASYRKKSELQVETLFRVTGPTGKKRDEMLTRPSVNRLVAGSNPARGAKLFNHLLNRSVAKYSSQVRHRYGPQQSYDFVSRQDRERS